MLWWVMTVPIDIPIASARSWRDRSCASSMQSCFSRPVRGRFSIRRRNASARGFSALNGDANLTGLLRSVGRPEPVGPQHELPPRVSQSQDGWRLTDRTGRCRCQRAAELGDLGRGSPDPRIVLAQRQGWSAIISRCCASTLACRRAPSRSTMNKARSSVSARAPSSEGPRAMLCATRASDRCEHVPVSGLEARFLLTPVDTQPRRGLGYRYPQPEEFEDISRPPDDIVGICCAGMSGDRPARAG